MTWYRFDSSGTRLTLVLRIQPGAKKTEVAGPHGDALKVKVAAPPVDDKANDALVKFLAQAFGVAARQVTIKSGAAARSKIVEILEPEKSPKSLWN